MSDLDPLSSRDLAAEFNRSCFCMTLDRGAMAEEMRRAADDPAFYAAHVESRPHLFSGVPVFLPAGDRDAMLDIVHAIEGLARTARYREEVLSWAPAIARQDFGPAGAFMGYDFHLGAGAPRLIEVNTNAGGAFLNAFSARAQLACCDIVEPFKKTVEPHDFDGAVVAMFETEWRNQRASERLVRIAIIDDDPQNQYLFPEFVLAQRLLQARGIDTLIADPAALSFSDGELRVGEQKVDLVYNRLVDFALSEPRHAMLRDAYLQDAVVLTPNPHTHALFADKRNLTVLSNRNLLNAWGVAAPILDTLASIPHAVRVRPQNADALWASRKSLFFKPVAGHGGKAVYRGDKLTRSTWLQILSSEYIAQDLAPPGERSVMIDGTAQPRKMDVRLYTYAGRLLLAAARLYQGQTTNFRTAGGGFAPVYFL